MAHCKKCGSAKLTTARCPKCGRWENAGDAKAVPRDVQRSFTDALAKQLSTESREQSFSPGF